jgi:hypothetical protein
MLLSAWILYMLCFPAAHLENQLYKALFKATKRKRMQHGFSGARVRNKTDRTLTKDEVPVE